MKKDYYDDWAQYLEVDEKTAYHEVMDWENRQEQGTSLFQNISLAVVNEIKKLSPEILTSTANTIREILKVLRDYSFSSINENTLSYKISLKCKRRVLLDRSIEQIPVGILDEAARECISFNRGAACVSGGLTGTVGFSGMLLDIPVLYGLLFRLIQETAICYGYRVNTPEEKLYILKILELGHIPEDTSRRSTITELHTLHTAMRGGVSLNQLEARTLIRGFDEVASKIGILYSRRKIMTGLMILGGIIGAATNYVLTREVSLAAYNTYRKRFIMDRALARRMKRI